MFPCADGDWLLKRGTGGRAKPQKQWEEMRPKTGSLGEEYPSRKDKNGCFYTNLGFGLFDMGGGEEEISELTSWTTLGGILPAAK